MGKYNVFKKYMDMEMPVGESVWRHVNVFKTTTTKKKKKKPAVEGYAKWLLTG